MILHRPLDPATKATVSCEWQHARFEAAWAQTCALLQMWECCGCALHPHPFGSYQFALLSDFLAHVDEHRAAGLHVPDAETLRARCVKYAEATRDAEDGK